MVITTTAVSLVVITYNAILIAMLHHLYITVHFVFLCCSKEPDGKTRTG
jgi:hypothetical protein